ncbi:MAG: outer membrane beta-barrel protein [Paludibacteraceae bacterium]
MKSIKKIAFVAFATILSVSFATAQVGIQAGYGTQTRNYENSALGLILSENATLSGFHVGPVADLKIQGPISLQYGLLYNYLTLDKSILSQNIKLTSHALDLPVRVKASIPFGDGLGLFLFAGPNFNYTVAEVIDINDSRYKPVGQSNESIYTWVDGNDKKLYAPFDVQLGAGAGLQFKGLSVRFSYDFGMLDKDNSDNGVWKNNDMKIGLAYTF